MLKIIWYGTNSIKLIYNNKKIIIDPFIRYNKRNNYSFANNLIEKNVLITHGHIDHLSDIKNIYNNKKFNIYCTKTPSRRLIKDKIKKEYIKTISYNETFNIDDFNIKVYKSKHINFDYKLIFKTLFNKRIIKYNSLLPNLLKKSIIYKEANETVLYNIKIDNKNIIIMGSMNIVQKINYPKNIDYLFLPYQGRSDLDKKVIPIIETFNPKTIILTHFDDSFPPISSNIDLDKIKKILKTKKIELIIPKYEKEVVLK